MALDSGGDHRGFYGMVGQINQSKVISMAQENRISLVITPQQKADILAAIAALNDVNDIQRALGEVNQALADTATQLGHEIILPDIAFYNNVAFSAKNHVPGAQAIADDLKERFNGGRKSKNGTPPPTA